MSYGSNKMNFTKEESEWLEIRHIIETVRDLDYNTIGASSAEKIMEALDEAGFKIVQK